jgi:hypothetical protein
VSLTLAWRNNNPGNLVYGKFAVDNGAVGRNMQFAIFSDVQTGENALTNLLGSVTYPDLNVDQAISRYAPSFQNDTSSYQGFIQNTVGASGSNGMSTLNSERFMAIVHGIEQYEGWSVGTIVHTYGGPLR